MLIPRVFQVCPSWVVQYCQRTSIVTWAYHCTIPHHVVHGGNRHWVDIPKHILSHPTVPWEGMVRLGSYHCVLLVCPVPIFDPFHPTVAWEGIDRQGYKSFLQKRQLMPPYSHLVCRKLYQWYTIGVRTKIFRQKLEFTHITNYVHVYFLLGRTKCICTPCISRQGFCVIGRSISARTLLRQPGKMSDQQTFQ